VARGAGRRSPGAKSALFDAPWPWALVIRISNIDEARWERYTAVRNVKVRIEESDDSKAQGRGTQGCNDAETAGGWKKSRDNEEAARCRTEGGHNEEATRGSCQGARDASGTSGSSCRIGTTNGAGIDRRTGSRGHDSAAAFRDTFLGLEAGDTALTRLPVPRSRRTV
jgi:hypothetical protein